MAEESPRAVEAKVVDELPRSPRSFYHPLSGAVILGLDWLAFGTDVLTGFVELALSSVVVFVVTYLAVQAIQIRLHGDSLKAARLKALLGAVAAGAPFPIGGSLLGAGILMMSGLSRWRRR
jgi:hypothetical protein